jgi:hypothetical protein
MYFTHLITHLTFFLEPNSYTLTFSIKLCGAGMKLGFWKLDITAGIGNTRNRPISHAQPIRSGNPVRIFLSSGSPLPAVRLATHSEDLYDVTDSSWASTRFQYPVFSFYPTDDVNGRHIMVSQHSNINSMYWFFMDLFVG